VESHADLAATGVSTLRLEELLPDQPGSADDGRHPPRRLRDRWGDEAERAGLRWAALVWVVVLVALLVQDPGRMTFDTKLGVNIDPVGFYERLWHLWNPLEYLGSLQDQYIGYAFPMGAFYLIAHLLHVPVWVDRAAVDVAADHGGLPGLGPAGRGDGHRNTQPRGCWLGPRSALWPTFTILVGSSSGGILPGVLAPWVVLPLIGTGSARAAGRTVGPPGRLHGGHQRGLHPRRACAARNVHTDQAGAAAAGSWPVGGRWR
jgi:arabinofuranan 3-O-arabinosyltransferase